MISLPAFSSEVRRLLSEGPDFVKKAMPSFLDELEKIALEEGYLPAAAQRAFTESKSIPGRMAKQVGQGAGAMLTPRSSFKKGWQATFHPQGKPLGLGWKAFMGYSLYGGLKDAIHKEDPTGHGHSRARRILRLAGDQAGGIIGAPYGLPGSITSTIIGNKIGDTVGAGLEKLVGYRSNQQPHLPPPPQGSR